MLRIVNITPASLSGESHQDSEPNLAVNPLNALQMVATAFTPDPMNGPNAPIYVSTNGGNTWSLRSTVPGNNPSSGTGDITVAFAGGMLYVGTLNGSTGQMNILRTASFTSNTAMTTLVNRGSEDQPWVVAGVSGTQHRVFVGNEDGNQPGGMTATVDVSQNASVGSGSFVPVQLERRSTVFIPSIGRGKDGPPIRTAFHPNGTVYAAFQRWASGNFPNLNVDIVVTRDDAWGASTPAFAALIDPNDTLPGKIVAPLQFVPFMASMGQERLGADLAIAVDPTDSSTVWIAWGNRVGGMSGTDWTLHVRRSTDRGKTWSADLRTITNAKNPALALNSNRLLGLAYQQFTGTTWDTKLELTSNGWHSPVVPLVLHKASATSPAATFLPYTGDYIRMLCIGTSFYGVFCGNNTPNMANFPNGVTYQRLANWTTHTLLSTNGVTTVPVSIDPFFFQWSPDLPVVQVGAASPPVSNTGPVTPGPVGRGPIMPGLPNAPESGEPPSREGAPKRRKTKPAGGKPAPKRRKSRAKPTDMDL